MAKGKSGISKDFHSIINKNCCNRNSGAEMSARRDGYIVDETVHITGITGSVNLNVFRIVGTIVVLKNYAQFTEIATLTNMTNVYSDLWDGTSSKILTKTPGNNFSSVQVGSFFTKNKKIGQNYSIAILDVLDRPVKPLDIFFPLC